MAGATERRDSQAPTCLTVPRPLRSGYGVLIDVCCHLKGLEEAERAAGWPQRSGKIVLQLALTRLARHYGLETHISTNTAGAVRHWGSSDYRPQIDVQSEPEA